MPHSRFFRKKYTEKDLCQFSCDKEGLERDLQELGHLVDSNRNDSKYILAKHTPLVMVYLYSREQALRGKGKIILRIRHFFDKPEQEFPELEALAEQYGMKPFEDYDHPTL